MLTAEYIIEYLDLEPLSFEGGYFRRTYLSTSKLDATRHLSSAIYYLLTPDTYSKIHCLPADEIYHFYLGDPIELLLLNPAGQGEIIRMGPNLSEGEALQVVVPAQTWHGSRLRQGGQLALLGTTMSPAFNDIDFTRPLSMEYLLKNYPDEFHDLIRVLY